MPRKHVFVLVVVLGAAVVAGLLALSSSGTVNPTAAPTSLELAARERSLDQLEATIRRSLAQQSAAAAPTAGAAPRTVFVRPAPAGAGAAEHEHEDEDEEHEGDDD